MELKWSATFPYKPVSVDHAYPTRGRGGRFLSKEGKIFREQVQWFVKTSYSGKLLTGDLEMTIDYTFGDKRRRDVDNWHKVFIDSLKGFIFEDDSQIQKLTLTKTIGKTTSFTAKIYG